MAKTAGMGDNFYVSGYDIGGDTNSIGKISGGPAALDVTDITQSAFSRLGGERDGGMDFVVYHDTAALASHAALSTLPTTDAIVTYGRGGTIGNPAASLVAKQVNYDPTRGQDGSLTFAVNAVANGFGLEWGIQLTADLRTDTVATVGPAFDNVAPFSFGAQGYLQVTAFSGTDATVSITHCATSGGAYSPLITFAQTTAGTVPGAQRVTAAGSVLEFFKVKTVTSGGFTSITFTVMIAVNTTAVVF